MENSGKELSIGNTKITLIGIDRNIATLLIKGDRREKEGLKEILLNKDGKRFSSTSSVAIDADLYDIENKSVRAVSDEELKAQVENFDFSQTYTKQVKKIKVYGNIDKIIYMKVNSADYLDIDFDITVNFDNGY